MKLIYYQAGPMAYAKRSLLHVATEAGDSLCGRKPRGVQMVLHREGEPTCKGCLKKLAALPVTVERQGITRSGSKYFMQVMVSGMTINGQTIPNEVAARAMADKLESGFAGPPEQRQIEGPRKRRQR